MKKIGILTFWGVPNYGAWMQAYALNKVIKSIDKENDVKHISYLDQFHYSMYYEKDEHLLNAFSYNWSAIPHTKVMDIFSLENEQFDVIVTGSDSIWEFSSKSTNDDVHLIGNRLLSKKIVAYAASAGVTAKERIEKNFIFEGLKNYSSISVRDNATKEMVKNAIGKEVPIVLDPSLLYDFPNDNNIKESVFDNFIFVYGVVWDEEFVNKLKNFAKRNKLRLISAGYINNWCDLSFRMIELRTFEWLGLLKNSSFVATSMFHGLMLGISFSKRVFFNQHEYVKDRSNMFLDLLEMPFYNKAGEKDMLDFVFENEIDVNAIKNKIEFNKNQSLEILRKMIIE